MCQLNVPQGSKEAYRLHPYWQDFFYINELSQDEDALPVEDIISDNISDHITFNNGSINIKDKSTPIVIYNISGKPIYNSHNSIQSTIDLPSDVYIIKIGQKAHKIRL